MSRSLEERARSARASMEDAVRPVEPPPFDPPPEGAPRTLVAVVGVAILALGGWLLFGNFGEETVVVDTADEAVDAEDGAGEDPAEDPTASSTPDVESFEPTEPNPEIDLPAEVVDALLVFDPPPAGFVPEAVVPNGGRDELAPRFSLYGRSDVDDPFLDGDLAVARVTALPEEEVADGEEIEIAGLPAWVPDNGGEGLLTIVMYDDYAADTTIAFLSASRDRSELIAIAEAYRLTGEIDAGDLDLLVDQVIPQSSMLGSGNVTFWVRSTDEPASEIEAVLTLQRVPGTIEEIVLFNAWFAIPSRGEDPAPGPIDLLPEQWSVTVDGEPLAVTRIPSMSGVHDVFQWQGDLMAIGYFANGERLGIPPPEEIAELIATIRPATEADLADFESIEDLRFGG